MATTESTPLMTTVRLDDATRERVFPSASLASSPVPSRVALGESPLRKHPRHDPPPQAQPEAERSPLLVTKNGARTSSRRAILVALGAVSALLFVCACVGLSSTARDAGDVLSTSATLARTTSVEFAPRRPHAKAHLGVPADVAFQPNFHTPVLVIGIDTEEDKRRSQYVREWLATESRLDSDILDRHVKISPGQRIQLAE